jgi:carotenoid cleavage dioxygenase-like enzyme
MATLTRNLFWGQGERDHQLTVTEGHWPDDIDGSVFIVGPDKRSPGGHWFGEHGLICRIDCAPGADGRIAVRHRRVDTPLARIRDRLPFLFKKVEFLELSPFGVSNFANTNVQPIDGRMFVGYDAGRPIEIDPDTLDYVTAVGANDEWFQGAPGVLEPLVAVAAHPGPDFEERSLYFLNYSQIPVELDESTTFIARWDLEGAVQRWRLEGMSDFDSLHDIKVTRDYLVFTDLPFVVDEEKFRGGERSKRNQDHTNLWIVAKADLEATPPGESVDVTEIQIPFPTGHLSVDYENPDGRVRVFLQHIPLNDLMISVTRDDHDHRNGEVIDPNYEGLIALALQPGAIGRYEIDAESGEVVDREVVHDADRFWGQVLATQDTFHPEARARQRQLWMSGLGFDPDLIPEEWWRLYGNGEVAGIVAPADLPTDAKPGALVRLDLEAMKLAEVFTYGDGAFPHPPTFVPRTGATDPDDGYVVVVVHRDGPKAIQIFDAAHIENGPLATATGPDFNPPLLLHSHWMPERKGPRPSDYRVSVRRDLVGALKGIGPTLKMFASVGRQMKDKMAAGSEPST